MENVQQSKKWLWDAKGGQPIRITVRHGDEYRSRIACIYQEDSFFYSAYQQAGRCVAEIILATQRYCGTPGSRAADPCDSGGDAWVSESARLAAFPNNIIAFCGERGSGKTSAMVSFSRALDRFRARIAGRDEDTVRFWNACMPEGLRDLSSYCFEVLDSIDPTSMEQTDSILRIILSRLFDRFQSAAKDSAQIDYRNDRDAFLLDEREQRRQRLLQSFQECFKALDTLKDKKNEDVYYDDLSYLADLGDSSKLKQKVQRLVEELCRLLTSGQKQCFLVLQIDDADLNAQHAFAIMEDLRKYMMLPRVIILLSAELRQLEAVVEQHYMDEFRSFIDCTASLRNHETVADQIRYHDAAENYIDKLFPGAHQIHLPDVDRALHNAFQELTLSYMDGGEDLLRHRHMEYQTRLLRMIYDKTRIILLKPSHHRHDFIPSTMRMLTHFLAVLCPLPDLDEHVTFDQLYLWNEEDNPEELQLEGVLEERRKCLHNLLSLEQYFRHSWCHLNLSAKEQIEMSKLFQAPFSEMHQQSFYLIQALSHHAPQKPKSCTYAEIFNSLRHLGDSFYRGQYAIKFAVEFHYTLSMHRKLITQRGSEAEKREQLWAFIGYAPIDIESMNVNKKLWPYLHFRLVGKDIPVNDLHSNPRLKNLVFEDCEIILDKTTLADVLSQNTVHVQSFVYNLSRLLASNTLWPLKESPDSHKQDYSMISPIQFLINTDMQNAFLKLINRISEFPSLPLSNFIISILEKFNQQLDRCGIPVQWDLNQPPYQLIDEFDHWLKTLPKGSKSNKSAR